MDKKTEKAVDTPANSGLLERERVSIVNESGDFLTEFKVGVIKFGPDPIFFDRKMAESIIMDAAKEGKVWSVWQ